MRTPCCHSLFASILKFLNFLQAFMGVSIILYSVYMLNQWNNHHPFPPPPSSAPSPNSLAFSSGYRISPLDMAIDFADGYGSGPVLRSITLPDPWFIYAFMGLGIALLFVTAIGHIAAEVVNGCCLCFYTSLSIVIFILEAALVGFILIDGNWDKDIPFDSTGELDNLREFVMDNIDLCRWVGIALISIQALSLLIALTLRAMVYTPKADDGMQDSYETIRVQTTNHNHVPDLTSVESKLGAHSDNWTLRMKEKYGFNGGERQVNPDL